ncbi:MAG TPA: cytochrome C oxidase subunit IV family protein [Saprospiraceae bacterium]|nr:cytochrome C oxidase subunit IV family protein [Saprospiraceae bacterium]
MSHTYERSKKIALKTIIVLGVVTVIEVMIALTGKGYIIEGVHFPWYIMNFVMICMSLYKAYLIVGEFMHMKHEVRALGMTVILPTFLLIWAIIAFMYEGGAWKGNRNTIKEKNRAVVEESVQPQGMLFNEETGHLQ